jgi:hypothetical protein
MVTMNSKETKKMVEEMKLWSKKVCATPETARKALMDIGIIDKNGNLTEPYRAR